MDSCFFCKRWKEEAKGRRKEAGMGFVAHLVLSQQPNSSAGQLLVEPQGGWNR